MKPIDLYTGEFEEINNDLTILHGFLDLNEWEHHLDKMTSDLVTFKYIKNHNYDYRRVWILVTIWFNDIPCAIFQKAGRNGCDYIKEFITDVQTTNNLIKYIKLKSICLDDPLIIDEISETLECDDKLTTFYHQSLDDYFETYYNY